MQTGTQKAKSFLNLAFPLNKQATIPTQSSEVRVIHRCAADEGWNVPAGQMVHSDEPVLFAL